jgi:hypothetical protein
VDVHAPHHPIMGWKDFLLHLVTITIGLLIAVGIEGLVELHREHTLVKEARKTLHDEIAYNSRKLDDALKDIDSEKSTMNHNVKLLTRVLEDPKDKDAQKGSIRADFVTVGLHDTAWKTAQATGALAYMPYSESQRYADLYGAQQDFLGQQGKLLEDEAQLLGVFAKTDFGHNDVTPEQASLALERFGIWRSHLMYLGLMAKVSALSDKAFLEGKEAPTSMSEEISK